MTRLESIEELTAIRSAYSDKKYHEERLMNSEEQALDMAISAIELITHLNNRPCEACEYKVDGNCTQWDCVFDELVYWDRRQEWRKNNVDTV